MPMVLTGPKTGCRETAGDSVGTHPHPRAPTQIREPLHISYVMRTVALQPRRTLALNLFPIAARLSLPKGNFMKFATRHFIAAGLLATLGLAVTAQTPPPAAAQGPAAHGMQAHEGRGRMMDPAKREQFMQERMALPVLIKEYCGITGETFAQFREQYQRLTMADLNWFRAEFEKMSTPERIDRMRAMRTARQAEADKRGDATKTFYTALSAEQKKTFDELSARTMQGKGGGHGGHHFGGHFRT